ncbi:MAG: MFS transporter [Actinobacteria bacterium]|nr:MFS transporter [Actinomycetota bacterium]
MPARRFPTIAVRPAGLILALQIVYGLLASAYGLMFTLLDDWRDAYGIPESRLGAIIAVGFFTTFFSQVVLAPIADRGRTRGSVVLGCGMIALGALVMAAGSSFGAFFTGRFVSGLGIGLVVPAMRRVVIVSDPARVGRNLGRGLSIEVAGFAVGPLIALATVGPFGLRAPYVVMTVLTVGLTAFVAFLPLPEVPAEGRTAERFAFDLLHRREFAGTIMLGVAFYLKIGVSDALWVVILDDIGAPSWMSTLSVASFALPWLLFGTVGGRVAQRIGAFTAALVGALCTVGFLVFYGVVGSPVAMILVSLVQVTLDAFTFLGVNIMVARITSDDRQAGAAGLLGGSQALTAGTSAIAAGILYEHIGRAATMSTMSIAILVIALAAVAVAGRRAFVAERA